jgi:hypothetical protein
MWFTSQAQQRFDFVFDYFYHYENQSKEFGGVYSRFKTGFGTDSVKIQQARIDSMIDAANALWKDHIKSMPGYKGDDSYADGMKSFIKFLRGDFKKGLLNKKGDLFQAPVGTTEEELNAEQKVVFDHYKDLITAYANKIEEYNAKKSILENNFADEADSYVLAKIDSIVKQIEDGSLKENLRGADSILMNVLIFGKRGDFHQFSDYAYVKFDFTNSTDKQRVYGDYQYLADKMSKGGDEYVYYQNSYMYGGQDAYVAGKDNECSSGVLKSTCTNPWIAHLSYWEGLYSGKPGCELKIRFQIERSSDTQD